ncbi:MAG: GNAT family N-acetyltransferase [Nitrospinae bacterium]|nr:GNAT family N-acetyltransferase [Nitrospinota bacterium]
MNYDDAPQLSHLVEVVITKLAYYNTREQQEELAKYSREALCALIECDPDAVLVAAAEGDIVGFCISRYDDGVLWLSWFGVREDHRGAGIGRELLSALESSCPRRKCHKIWCDTRVPNDRSARVLANAGYHKVCTLLNHWYGQDFHIWEKVLAT